MAPGRGAAPGSGPQLVETGLLGLLGDQLSSRGRQNLAEILTVHESYLAAALSAIHDRYSSVDTWLEQEYQLTPEAREALRSWFLEG